MVPPQGKILCPWLKKCPSRCPWYQTGNCASRLRLWGQSVGTDFLQNISQIFLNFPALGESFQIISTHHMKIIWKVLHFSLSPSFPLLIKCINIVFQNISQTLSNKNIKPDWQVNFEYCQKDYFLRNFQINLDHPLIVGKLYCRFFFRNIKITQKTQKNTPRKKP